MLDPCHRQTRGVASCRIAPSFPVKSPVVIVGVAVYLVFSPLGLSGSYTGLILAHAVLGVPFVVITVTATLQGFDYNLIRAAASLGADPVTAFFKVTLPLVAPGVISGALFAFATSFDEVVVTLFLASPEQSTLPRQMFSGIRDNISPTIAAVATVLVVVIFILVAVIAASVAVCTAASPGKGASSPPSMSNLA